MQIMAAAAQRKAAFAPMGGTDHPMRAPHRRERTTPPQRFYNGWDRLGRLWSDGSEFGRDMVVLRTPIAMTH
jgi:hypothetical protein